MSNYWIERQEKAAKARADKSIKDIEKQLKKYYSGAMERVIADFEATYNKILEAKEDGKEPTPADLYKLDQYWKMQAQLNNEMQKLGDKEIALLSREFEKEWKDIYKSIALPSDAAFSTFSADNAKAMINSAWLADGKTFSQRVWGNTERLVETLNEELVHCVVTGKKPTELRKLLQERFNVSYNRADTLVRTEAAHIETAAAAQRYQDYGLKKYEFLGRDEHDIGCACKKLDGKTFFYSEMQVGKNAPPLHPNCRCAIIPVIDEDEIIMEDKNMEEKKKKTYTANKPHTNAAIKNARQAALEKEGEFTWYTHHCDSCGSWFESKKGKPKKCPVCGEAFNYNSQNTKQNDIINKRCANCGKLFNDVEKVYFADGKTSYIAKGKNVLCKECRNELLASRDAEKLKKHGYTEKGIIKALTGQNIPENKEYKKDTWDLYWEYLRKHPEQSEELDKIDYMDYEKRFNVCIDCGEVFLVNNKNNAAKRCPECQAEFRRKYKAQKEKERRKRKKNN